MKFLSKIYKSFLKGKERILSRKTSVNFNLDRLLISEAELKELLVEKGDLFFRTEMRSCTNWDWKSEPLPLGRSKLEVKAEFDLTLWARLIYALLPRFFLNKQKEVLKEQFVLFFGWAEGNSRSLEKKTTFLRTFLDKPRSLLFSSLHYNYILLSTSGDFPLDCIQGGLPLTHEGKLSCFVKLYHLRKIEYLLKSRIFDKPTPIVCELYVKVKEKYKDDSLGMSVFAFQGRFLQIHKDNYLLDYWGMGPTVQNEILRMFPYEFTNIPNRGRSQDRIIRERNWEHCLTLPVETVKEFMNSGDQVSTFSHSHRE